MCLCVYVCIYITYKVESNVRYLLAICVSFLEKFWLNSFTIFLWVFLLFLLVNETTVRTFTIVLPYLPYLLWYLSKFLSFLWQCFRDWWSFYCCLQHVWLNLVAKSGNPKFLGTVLRFCLLSSWSVNYCGKTHKVYMPLTGQFWTHHSSFQNFLELLSNIFQHGSSWILVSFKNFSSVFYGLKLWLC